MPTNDTNLNDQTQAPHSNCDRAQALIELEEVFFTWYQHEKRIPWESFSNFLLLWFPLSIFGALLLRILSVVHVIAIPASTTAALGFCVIRTTVPALVIALGVLFVSLARIPQHRRLAKALSMELDRLLREYKPILSAEFIQLQKNVRAENGLTYTAFIEWFRMENKAVREQNNAPQDWTFAAL